MKSAYNSFKYSACYSCGYCKEYKLPENAIGILDIRKNGIVKIWCYAADNVISIMTAMKKQDCPYFIQAENE